MIGIDISDRSIKIIEIASGGTGQLRTAGWYGLAPNLMRRGIIYDSSTLTQSLVAALSKCTPLPLKGGKVVMSIPETQSFVRVVELPHMSHEEMEEAVQWAIRQHIPFDLDRVYLDWQPLPTPAKEPGHHQVLVGAAQREVIDPLLKVADDAGLHVVAFELEAQALVRSLLPRDNAEVVGILLIDLGATSTNIIYFDSGTMRFTTSIQRGGDDLTQQLAQQLHIQPLAAAEKKAEVGTSADNGNTEIATLLRTGSLQLVQQIQQVVSEVTSQQSGASGIRAILLAGGSANLPGIVNVFAEVFPGVPVQMGNPWINIALPHRKKDSPPFSTADATHFTTAIGLALREEENA